MYISKNKTLVHCFFVQKIDEKISKILGKITVYFWDIRFLKIEKEIFLSDRKKNIGKMISWNQFPKQKKSVFKFQDQILNKQST